MTLCRGCRRILRTASKRREIASVTERNNRVAPLQNFSSPYSRSASLPPDSKSHKSTKELRLMVLPRREEKKKMKSVALNP